MEINDHRHRFCEAGRSKKRAAGGFHSTAFISGVFCSNNFTNTQKERERERDWGEGDEKDDLMNTEEVDGERRRKRGRVNVWPNCGKKSTELKYMKRGKQKGLMEILKKNLEGRRRKKC